MSKYPDALMIQESICTPQDNHRQEQGITDALEHHHNLGASSVITVFCELEALMYHHTYNNLFHNLLLKHDTPVCHNTVWNLLFKYEAPEYHNTLCSLIHHLLLKHHTPICHNTVWNLLFKYQAPEYHNTLCSLIHYLLFKHDTPICHLTMVSLIYHLQEWLLLHKQSAIILNKEFVMSYFELTSKEFLMNYFELTLAT